MHALELIKNMHNFIIHAETQSHVVWMCVVSMALLLELILIATPF